MYASFKDSHVSYEDYAKRAVELGHGILSCVEHGFQGNFLRAYEVAEKYGLKFVFGVEAYWVDDTDDPEHKHPNAHICIFAKNETGRREITAALSYAQEFTFWRVPRLGLDRILMLNPDNVFITTACVLYWGRVQKDTNELKMNPNYRENFLKLRERFGDSIMLEVQAHNTLWQKQANRLVVELARETDTKMIAGMDSHYIYPEQAQERRKLREEAGVVLDEDSHELGNGVYEDYPDEETLTQRFKEQGVLDNSQIHNAIQNTDIFLEFEDIHFSREKKLPTLYPGETQDQRNERYRALLREKWLEYRKSIDPADEQKYLDAITYEAETITSTGFSDYFLINHAIVDLGRKLGARVTLTSRGSGSSYFTNTLIGLSTIDRITLPVELYPERFVSMERLMAGQLPDVDINTSDQDILEDAQEQILGKGHAFPMVAYGTLWYKSAFRMYSSSVGVPVEEQDIVSAQISAYENELKYADDDDERSAIDIADFVDAKYMPHIEASANYRGIIVSKGKAPCSYLLYDGDIASEIGLMRIIPTSGRKPKAGYIMCTVIDGYAADDFGYVKNDLLQVDTVRLSAMAFGEAGVPQPSSKDLIEMTKDDTATWEIYEKGATLGINQCERPQAIEKVKLYKPKNLAELSAFVAAIRPGFKSMINQFLNRVTFSYGIPTLDRLLQGKYMKSSWMLYQEQIMKILAYAGFPMDSTYGIVKAISKKKLSKIVTIKPDFIEGFKHKAMEEDGMSERDAEKGAHDTWQVIEDSSAYSFNASHASAVALDGLYCAYIKAHHPLAFYKALMTVYQDRKEKDKISLAKDEMLKHFGIRTVTCKFRDDNRDFFVNYKDNTMSDALSSMKGVSASAANTLYAARNMKFDTFVDVLHWLHTKTRINVAVQKTLIKTDYFVEFGDRRKLMMIYDEFYDGETKFSKQHVEATQQNRLALLREKEISIKCLKLEKAGIIDVAEQLRYEANVLGRPLSVYDGYGALYTVIAVNDRPRTPIYTLYSAATGVVGTAKIPKRVMRKNVLKKGDTIVMEGYSDRDGGRYVDGRFRKDGTKELWVEKYRLIEDESEGITTEDASGL